VSERTIIVMPAFNAARTLESTYRKLPAGSFDEACRRNCESKTKPSSFRR
jgi:hypothetical protein